MELVIYSGFLVFVKLRPYRHHSVTNWTNGKLASIFYSPFEVLGNLYIEIAFWVKDSSNFPCITTKVSITRQPCGESSSMRNICQWWIHCGTKWYWGYSLRCVMIFESIGCVKKLTTSWESLDLGTRIGSTGFFIKFKSNLHLTQGGYW